MRIPEIHEQFIKRTPFYSPLQTLRLTEHQRKALREWENNGRLAPPHRIKQGVRLEYAALAMQQEIRTL
jgi:hypothetical protein